MKLTLFMLGREVSIPVSTIYINQKVVGGRGDSFTAEVLILNQWFERSLPANDIGLTIRKI